MEALIFFHCVPVLEVHRKADAAYFTDGSRRRCSVTWSGLHSQATRHTFFIQVAYQAVESQKGSVSLNPAISILMVDT
jgi:hypothetical protein